MKTLLIIAIMVGMKNSSTPISLGSDPKKNEVTFSTKQDYDIRLDDGSSVTLRAGTPIVVEATQSYSAKNLSEGQTVNVRVKYNVVVNKQTVIAAGALGNATISNITKPGIFGKAGRMELQMQSVQSVDGQQILVSSIPMMAEGQNKKGLAWGLSIGLFLFTIIGGAIGFFIKGKPAEIKVGTSSNASVASDAQVDVTPIQQEPVSSTPTERTKKTRNGGSLN
jgi:hypothetical protein